MLEPISQRKGKFHKGLQTSELWISSKKRIKIKICRIITEGKTKPIQTTTTATKHKSNIFGLCF